MPLPPRIPTLVRYFSKVDQSAGPDGCWPWTAAVDQDGYGIFWDGTYSASGRGHYVRVTRWTYEQFVGPIEGNLNVCHTCDNPPCVNIAHLFTGSHADNHADREAKGRGGQWKTRGDVRRNSKLTPEGVLAIRSRYAAGGVTMKELASTYRVSESMIGAVVHRRVWRHM